MLRNYCMDCGKSYSAEYVKNADGVPHCSCGGIIKPDVVLYEEALNEEVVEGAVHAIVSADVLIVLGTSLVVYPAACMPFYAKQAGAGLAIVNLSPTSADSIADVIVRAPAGEALGRIVAEVRRRLAGPCA